MSLGTILITLALILPPIVLWRCRAFCEKHPSTVPIRTVPLGCLTMFWVMLLSCSAAFWLYYSVFGTFPPHWLNITKDLLILLLALSLGIGVIVLLSRHLTQGKKAPRGYLYPIVFAVTLIVAGIISCCCTVGCAFKKGSRDWHTIILPQLQDCRLAFEQRPSHPFLAEYDYRLCLRYGKEQAIFQLWPNSGGRTFVNVYKIAEDKLLLEDKDASYIIDSTQKQVYLIRVSENDSQNEQREIHFAVPLCEKAFDQMGGHDEDFSVYFTDGTSSQAVPYDLELKCREYIGCIMDYSFCTPDEQPEGEGHPRYRMQE